MFAYISIYLTTSQRETNMQKDHLFLSFIPPHQVVKTCSIARWLKLVMEEAGIDMSKCKANSTRSTAVSYVLRTFLDKGFAPYWLWDRFLSVETISSSRYWMQSVDQGFFVSLTCVHIICNYMGYYVFSFGFHRRILKMAALWGHVTWSHG